MTWYWWLLIVKWRGRDFQQTWGLHLLRLIGRGMNAILNLILLITQIYLVRRVTCCYCCWFWRYKFLVIFTKNCWIQLFLGQYFDILWRKKRSSRITQLILKCIGTLQAFFTFHFKKRRWNLFFLRNLMYLMWLLIFIITSNIWGIQSISAAIYVASWMTSLWNANNLVIFLNLQYICKDLFSICNMDSMFNGCFQKQILNKDIFGHWFW